MSKVIYRDSILKTILIFNSDNQHTKLINRLLKVFQSHHYISKYINICFIKEKRNIRKILKIPYIITDSIMNLENLPLDILKEINSYLSFSIKFKHVVIDRYYTINNYINCSYLNNNYIIFNKIDNNIKLDYTYEFYYLKNGFYYPTDVKLLYNIRNINYSKTFIFFKYLFISTLYIIFTLLLLIFKFFSHYI